MTGRLAGKTAIVVGAGQTPGATIGNGRATALLFAREGAQLLLVDRDRESVEETARLARDEAPGSPPPEVLVVDIASSEDACRSIVSHATDTLGRIDVLHNNVGIGAGDSSPTSLTEDAWDHIVDVNLKAMWMTCKHVVLAMRSQEPLAGEQSSATNERGAIVCVSSVAAIAAAGRLTAYKVSKAGVNALVQNLAVTNARFGIRVNGIMPGLIDTPMAVDAVARELRQEREVVASFRAKQVPLGRQGTAWDVAHAALYLASAEAGFVTGAVLPVDGGQSAMVG